MQELEKKYNRLKKQLSTIDCVCQGSINVVYTKCGNAYCACAKDKAKKHGPYYLWSTKRNGKTISKRLSKKQVALCRKFINNYSKIKTIIEKMKALSIKIIVDYY